jgi:hypothetical protein
MRLTEHFTARELRVPDAPARIKANARALCAQILEPIRAHFGRPLVITSGYRSPERNRAAGGKRRSFHRYEGGHAAADFKIPGVPITEVFDWLRLESGLPFDKAILESSGGVPVVIHVQIDRDRIPRRLAYTGATGDATRYQPVEVA